MDIGGERAQQKNFAKPLVNAVGMVHGNMVVHGVAVRAIGRLEHLTGQEHLKLPLKQLA